LNVTLIHEIMQGPLETAHVGAVQILRGQVNNLHPGILFCTKRNNCSLLKNLLGFYYALE